MNKLIDDFLTPGTNRGIYYGGMFQKPSHDGVIEVLNPATAHVFTTVPDATAIDVPISSFDVCSAASSNGKNGSCAVSAVHPPE